MQIDSFSGKITEETLEELEEILILSDVSVATAGKICSMLGAKLKKKELIATKEGQNGGYHTSMKAADVNLAMIYDALEIEAVCASWKSGNPDMNCMVASGMADIMDDIYGQLNEVCREKLRRITIADIDNKIFHREER